MIIIWILRTSNKTDKNLNSIRIVKSLYYTSMHNCLCYEDQLATDKTEFFAHEQWFFLMMPHMKERLIICLKFDMIITKVSFPSVYINFIERNYN